MPSLSHSPVTFTWNFASSTSASDLLRSSHYGVSVVPLKSLGRARFGISKRAFTVSAKVRRGKKRHEYPWDDVPDPQTDGELCRAIHPFKTLKEKPKPVILEFEKPLIAARKKIMEIKKLVNEADLDLSGVMVSLENKLQKALTDAYMNLTPIQRVYIARHPHRPTCLDHIFNITDDVFLELHGDRHGYDDPAIVTGLGRMNDRTYMFIGHQKGRNTKESIHRNFGMPTPHGYRKALRMMHYADHYGFPIVTFIDTPGAFADLKSERLNQGEAIAQNLITMFGLKVPIISIVIGEGGSGGALAIACANKLLMLENAVFYVASPEACAAILYKSAKEAPKAARKLRITASELCKLKIADGIIPEPLGGAHTDPYWTSQQIKSAILKSMDELTKMDEQELLKHRQLKFRNMGRVGEGVPIDPFKKRNMKKREAKEGFHFKKRILDPEESFAEHVSNELSQAKNLTEKNKKECKLEKEVHVKSMDEEVEEESEDEGIDDDFFEESEDDGVVEESGNEEVDQDFFEESKDECVGKESEGVLDQAEINEEFILDLSETEEIEAVKNETEELELGEKLEALKKEIEEFERTALDPTEIKRIEGIKKKIEELERGEEITETIKRIEAIKKNIEELERGEEITEALKKESEMLRRTNEEIKALLKKIEELECGGVIEPLKKEIEEIDREIEAEEKEIEESERVEETEAVKKVIEEIDRKIETVKKEIEEIDRQIEAEEKEFSEIEEEIEAVKKKIEEFKRAEINEEVEEEFTGVLDLSEIKKEIEAVKKQIEELEPYDISEEVDEKCEDILGQSDIEKKTEALKKEIEGLGASSLEDLPEDMKNRLLQLKKAVSGAVSDDRVAYMRVDHTLTLSEFRERTTAINHEIKDAIDNSPDLVVKIERLELEVKRGGKRPNLEMRNKIQHLELEIKQGIDEALKSSEKYQKLVADLPKPEVEMVGMPPDFETIRKMLFKKQEAEQGTDVLNSSENYEKLMAEISEIVEPSRWSDGSLEENVNQNDSKDPEFNF